MIHFWAHFNFRINLKITSMMNALDILDLFYCRLSNLIDLGTRKVGARILIYFNYLKFRIEFGWKSFPNYQVRRIFFLVNENLVSQSIRAPAGISVIIMVILIAIPSIYLSGVGWKYLNKIINHCLFFSAVTSADFWIS